MDLGNHATAAWGTKPDPIVLTVNIVDVPLLRRWKDIDSRQSTNQADVDPSVSRGAAILELAQSNLI